MFANFQWQILVGMVQASDWAYTAAFVLLVVIFLMGPFAVNAAIGSRLGVLFNNLPALRAYSLNVAGSLAGSILLPVLSWFDCPPWILFFCACAIVLILQLKHLYRRQMILDLLMLAALLPILLFLPEQHSKPLIPELVDTNTRRTVIWSPYQRLDLAAFYGPGNVDEPATRRASPDSFLGLELGANRAFYQYYFSDFATHAQSLLTNKLVGSIKKRYALAFNLNHPSNALIVGAGTGQNVSSAVQAGVLDVDAVEIDPAILEIGKRYNPYYHSAGVHLICDDARHYFLHCLKKYDVIDFSTVDSHAVAGLGSSVRVDMYIYSVESIRSALSLLSDRGILLCSFVTMAPWTKERLYSTFKTAAGYAPLVIDDFQLGTIYILGNAVKDGSLAANPAFHDFPLEHADHKPCRILTDDWPYLYVKTDVIDYPYLLVLLEIVGLSLFAARRFIFTNPDPANWHLFFMGSAFMLLELHAITFLSLLYGATWLTSAIVIAGILIMILLANAAVTKYDAFFSRNVGMCYLALAATIACNYLIPAGQMLANGPAGHGAATLVAVLPMATAALIFAATLKKAKDVSGALAFNLFGAVIGGLLEYISSYTGIKSLLIASLLLYACSWFCWRSSSKRMLTSKQA